MIKPTELFQGAIVRYERYTFRVSGVVEEDIIDGQSYKGVETAIYLKKPHSMWRIPPKSQKKIKPIILTPKIVEKLGFREVRKDDSPFRYYRKGRIDARSMEIWFYYGELDYIWNEGVVLLHNPLRKQTYVHYLQRIIADETKIKIDFSKLL